MADFLVEHKLLYFGDVSHCLDTGTHPSPEGPPEVGAEKVLSSTIVIYEKWWHRGEVDRNSRGGSHTIKRVAHVGFQGCSCVSGWPSHHQSSACPFCQGLSSQADPHPLSLKQPRQAGGAGEWWLELQCSRGDEAVFTVYFSLRL